MVFSTVQGLFGPLFSPLWMHWNTLLIRNKKYCKARTWTGSQAKSRCYFGWVVLLSVCLGQPTAPRERGGMMNREDITLWRVLPLRPPSSSSDHSVGPLSPFSELTSWQSHSGTCAEEGPGGALLCNGTFTNRSSTLLKMQCSRGAAESGHQTTIERHGRDDVRFCPCLAPPLLLDCTDATC